MKSGFIAIVGRSNVGKSTLINRLVDTKVAITTPKPQTTRKPIHGVLNDPRGQAVFVDTPGLFQNAKDALTKTLNKAITDTLSDIDAVLYVTDSTRAIGSEEKHMLRILSTVKKPILVLLNKSDDYASKDHLQEYEALAEGFNAHIAISALHGSNLDLVKDWVFEQLPEGDPMYGEYDLSNLSPEERLAEIIREKIFLKFQKELPYTAHVVVDEIHSSEKNGMTVSARILTHSDRYRGMFIGKGGQAVKEIGSSARRELEAITGNKVRLNLVVEVDPHWISRLELS